MDVNVSSYYAADECVMETCPECPFCSAEEIDSYGHVACDWNSRRLRMVFENVTIDVLDPPPAAGTPFIRSLALNGSYTVPAL